MKFQLYTCIAICVFLIGCAAQQSASQKKDVIVLNQEDMVTEDSPASDRVTNTDQSLKLKADLLAFEKENFLNEKIKFEEKRMNFLKQLNERDSLFSIKEQDLQARTSQLDLREKVIDEKLTKLEKTTSQASIASTMPSSNNRSQESSNRPVEASPKRVLNSRASDLKQYRYIQFVASTGGKTYYQYAYLGEVITEQIPGKNIYRYKIKGKFDDQQVKDIIQTLKEEGFAGTFEVR